MYTAFLKVIYSIFKFPIRQNYKCALVLFLKLMDIMTDAINGAENACFTRSPDFNTLRVCNALYHNQEL